MGICTRFGGFFLGGGRVPNQLPFIWIVWDIAARRIETEKKAGHKKNYSTHEFEPASPCNDKRALQHYAKVTVHKDRDVRYRIKLYSDIRYNVGLRSRSPISEVLISGSVRYRWSLGCPPKLVSYRNNRNWTETSFGTIRNKTFVSVVSL
jgi:hypothetical protein